jgi:hypothetical protein
MEKVRVKYTLGKDVNLDKEIVLDTNGSGCAFSGD